MRTLYDTGLTPDGGDDYADPTLPEPEIDIEDPGSED
jgi:hypothetical protein